MESTYINQIFALIYVVILSYAVVSDYLRTIIPNWCSIVLVVIFLLFAIVFLTMQEFLWHLLLCAIVFALGIGFYAFGWIGGGDAKLELVEAEDPLEAGLEIFARPPGKRRQALSLLSGGEQALTALSLIFAVFHTNPSPICVLDEVDAPLDDANVQRFCNLIDEMTRTTDTRYLIITHHPYTMSRMDRLFGVTMGEKGVSQLVSVNLEMAERFLEAGE